MAALAPMAGKLSDRYPAHYIATAGTLMVAIGFILLLFVDEHTSTSLLIFILMLMGTGHGLFSTPNSNAALASIPESRMAIGSALVNLARLAGNMLGTLLVALLMAVYIGGNKILPEQYPALLQVMHWAMGISALLALAGGWFSWRRKRYL